ncbi:tetratricopeptide repeat protein [Ningiella sp. W23]|uniref:tetratricopeptide repeat protein n=1 Tax=Ningiella sp. W23 TaxID=3023715 RepID=UPI003757B0C9
MSAKLILLSRMSFLVLIVSFVSACYSTHDITFEQNVKDAEYLFKDEAFPASKHYDIETPESIFALSDEAKTFVDASFDIHDTQEQRMFTLMQRILDISSFDLLYRADANTPASETFENRAANCLSLTIMTYAMARHAGLNTRFQQVDIPEFWTRREGYSLLNGHINIRMFPADYQQAGITLFRRDYVVDFDPQDGRNNFRTRNVSKERIVAMYYNNIGAELILDGELSKAYAYLRAALSIDAGYEGALLNLGFVYRQVQEYGHAEMAYKAALELDEDYLTAWENLAALYEATERVEQANDIYARLEKERRSNPYYHMMLAEVALDEQNYEDSIAHFKRAISLDDEVHQFYSGLAQVYLNQGNIDQTTRYLTVAKRKAGKTQMSQRYGEKLSMLANLQTRQ